MKETPVINILVSVLLASTILITSLIFFPIALLIRVVTYPFDKQLKALHLFTSFWGAFYIWVMPSWKVKVSGKDKIQKETYVIVSNHQSQLDILAAFTLFVPFKWVSKIEMFKVPLVGWNMSLNQYVKINRGRRESIKQMLSDCRQRLTEGSSVFFFPEGTRSTSGELRQFKAGAFKLAHEMKLPILPVALDGTKDALPKGAWKYSGKQVMTVDVLPPIPYEEYKHLDPQETADHVRSLIIDSLAK